MTKKKVVIIQNRIVKGGRFQVIHGFVKVLNDLGIVPDILTLRSKVNYKDAQEYYGDDVSFNLKEIFFDIRIPSDMHILFFNFLMRFYLKDYSLVINSTNSSYLLPNWARILSYVHFPRKARLLSPKVSIHFPDGENKSWFKPSHVFINFAAFLYRLNNNQPQGERVVTNSFFTRKEYSEFYKVDENKIEVIYPPVWQGKIKRGDGNKNFKMVCSLGRFAEDKRQIEQILIAQELKDYQFHLMGFANENDPYFIKCKNLLEDKKIANVYLHPNLDYKKMNHILSESGYFIHSMRNEPFGIVTVQAIANGCVPIVHNSGGQREIVIDDRLRYNNIEEAVNKFRNLEECSTDDLSSLLKKLVSNAMQYTYKEFEERTTKILRNELGIENES